MELNALRHSEKFEAPFHCRMLDVIEPGAGFGARIDDTIPVFEKRRKVPAGQVAIFIDARSDDGTPMVTKPSGVIGASS